MFGTYYPVARNSEDYHSLAGSLVEEVEGLIHRYLGRTMFLSRTRGHSLQDLRPLESCPGARWWQSDNLLRANQVLPSYRCRAHAPIIQVISKVFEK